MEIFKEMRESVLTKGIRGTILTRIRKMLDNDEIKGFYPKLMHEQNTILCFLDLKPIELNTEYTSIKGHGKTSKYFHRDCYDRMHY